MNDQVREGYDEIADAYAASRDQFKNDAYLERFAANLAPGSTVLDVGCGSGLPAARFLVEKGFKVRGLDISPRQIELARANVPLATFEVTDMEGLDEGQFAVDGIVALYSLFHVDRRRHARLLKTLRSFLPPGGVLLVTMGPEEWEGTEDFFGVEMAWSHFGPERNRQLLRKAGFVLKLDEIDETGSERHQIVLAIAT